MRIEIPANALVVLVGPAGSGKSTFASRHFRPTQVVSSDECRALISDDPGNQGVSRHAFELLHLIVEKRLLLGRLTVADATNLSRQPRRKLLRLAQKFNATPIAIVFNLQLETYLARNARRNRVVPVETVKDQYDQLPKAIQQICEEGFSKIYILDESTEGAVTVQIRNAGSQ